MVPHTKLLCWLLLQRIAPQDSSLCAQIESQVDTLLKIVLLKPQIVPWDSWSKQQVHLLPKGTDISVFLWQMAWCPTVLQLDSSLYCREAPSFISTILSMMELLGTGKSWETLIIRLGKWPPEENNTLSWPGNNTQWINQLASIYLALILGIVR